MKRKLIALLMAMMLIASGISAFALNADGTYNDGDIVHLERMFAANYDPIEVDKQLNGYTISEDGIYMVFEVYKVQFNAPAEGSEANDYYKAWAETEEPRDYDSHLAQEAVKPYVSTVKEEQPLLVKVDAEAVVIQDEKDIAALYPGYTIVYNINGQYLLTDGVKYVLATAKASTETPDIGGQVTTGPDDFDLKYSNYQGGVISAFSFKPEVFGNGVTFSHKNAKSLCSMSVKYEAKVVLQLRDQQGRLYPISGATYSAADNGYVVTMKADESKTFGWYGTDGAGYHTAGSLAKPATITLDLNVWATTTGKNADGSAWATDRADMRFDYIVKHGDDAHSGNYSGSSSSPKTGDARMAYLTLASLVVLAGVAVVITRKLRTNA